MSKRVYELYKHDPLPDPRTHIRLLKVLQGGFNQHVVCQMLSGPIATVPPYFAASYTWGDPSSTTAITINGQSMVVRRNCEYALQQIYVSSASSGFYIWLDALCINQNDNEEKSYQVAMMGQIYKQATCVHACVGEHADNSERVFDVIRTQAPILRSMHEVGFRKDHSFTWSQGRRFKLRSTRLEIWTSLLMDAKARGSLLRSFVAFIERPYFQRVWILQELFLASKTVFHCGADTTPGELLVTLSYLIEKWVYLSLDWLISSESKRARVFDITTRYFLLRGRRKSCSFGYENFLNGDWNGHLSGLHLASRPPEPFGLSSVLPYMSAFHCADPRDRLYGILSLAFREDQGKRPFPDYSKDTFTIVTELLHNYSMHPPFDPSLSSAIRLAQSFQVPLYLDRFDQAWRELLAFDTAGSARQPHNHHYFFLALHMLASPILAWNDTSRSDTTQRNGCMYITEATATTCTYYAGSETQIIHVPPETRVGDMFVSIHDFDTGPEFGFITRQCAPTRFGITGITNFVRGFEERRWDHVRKDAGAVFITNIFWHPLELQILGTVLAHYGPARCDSQILNADLNRICLAHLKATYVDTEDQSALSNARALARLGF